jgi:hypothetical protein
MRWAHGRHESARFLDASSLTWQVIDGRRAYGHRHVMTTVTTRRSRLARRLRPPAPAL